MCRLSWNLGTLISRVRFSMEFFMDINMWSTKTIREMSTRLRQPVLRADNLTTTSMCRLSWNLGTLRTCNRSARVLLYFLLFNILYRRFSYVVSREIWSLKTQLTSYILKLSGYCRSLHEITLNSYLEGQGEAYDSFTHASWAMEAPHRAWRDTKYK